MKIMAVLRQVETGRYLTDTMRGETNDIQKAQLFSLTVALREGPEGKAIGFAVGGEPVPAHLDRRNWELCAVEVRLK
jgi:hypothetical protein